MGTYLGVITIRNRYVNFKPLYEYENDELQRLYPSDRQALLPMSQYEDINFYSDDGNYAEDMFIDGEYLVLTFEDKDLLLNEVNGVLNPTGYRLEVSSKLDSGELRTLSDINRYFLLEKHRYDGSYRTNTRLIINDACVYEGLQVVIRADEENTVIGPFTVSCDDDGALYINTGLQRQKFILWGYQYYSNLDQYGISLGKYGELRTYLEIDDSICEKVPIDVITREQLLHSFRDTISSDYFVDGKIDLSQIGELLKAQELSLFVGDEVPEEVRAARFEEVSNLLTDEENLNVTFGFISSTITALLEKYQDDPQYSHLVGQLADNPDFMSKIQRFRIISDKIEARQAEFQSLSDRVAELQKNIEQLPRQEYAEGLWAEFEDQLQDLREKKVVLEGEIAELAQAKGDFQTFDELRQQVEWKRRDMLELEKNLDVLDKKLARIFEDTTETAIKFGFDGMLFSKMLKQAAQWENEQNNLNYADKAAAFAKLPLATETGASLVDLLVNQIQEYRPNYDKNAIVNILICYTQGFLTVFSGEPGTGKTSICKILSSVLGLNVPESSIPVHQDGYVATRHLTVPVEKGWTTKRDFIGYYNPLTKTFDRSNRKIFDALNILDLEAKGHGADMPFIILLDEANLSPMEYYWADYMNVCDDLDANSVINLGDNFCFRVSSNLRFLATINNDHTTEALSPRLIDRAWVVRLPKTRVGMSKPVYPRKTGNIVPWSALVHTFGCAAESYTEMSGYAKSIYDELLSKCRSAKINVSTRVDDAIRQYWSTAQKLFVSTADIDASIVALDYAVAQRILPHIEGSGAKFGEQLTDLQKFCSEKNLRHSSEILLDIIRTGADSMQYYHYFA